MLVYSSCTCWTSSGIRNGPMKYSTVCPSFSRAVCALCGCFLGIGSLGFSEFWHGARNPHHVVRDRAGGNGPKIVFFNLMGNFVINFY